LWPVEGKRAGILGFTILTEIDTFLQKALWFSIEDFIEVKKVITSVEILEW